MTQLPFQDMDAFYSHLLEKQNAVQEMPSNNEIINWVEQVLALLFPEKRPGVLENLHDVKMAFQRSEIALIELLIGSKACELCNHQEIAHDFFQQIPNLYNSMLTDATALLEGDPAAKNLNEIVRTYPGFFAISVYRIAHQLVILGVPLIPRMLSEYVHSATGIDIHPAAQIGEYLAIDHGTGLVIGETSIIGNHVKLYQGVTLGALSVKKEMANTKRHPTIEDNVVIYSNATILGGDTIIGANSVIGGNVWITKSVAPNSTIYHH